MILGCSLDLLFSHFLGNCHSYYYCIDSALRQLVSAAFVRLFVWLNELLGNSVVILVILNYIIIYHIFCNFWVFFY